MTKKKTTLCLIAGVTLLFVQCNQNEDIPESESQPNAIQQKQDNVTGGWKSIKVSETVKDLAAYVLAENKVTSPIRDISNVATQVVSGRNYRFQIQLENGELWEVQVYVNIQKERSITTFKQIAN